MNEPRIKPRLPRRVRADTMAGAATLTAATVAYRRKRSRPATDRPPEPTAAHHGGSGTPLLLHGIGGTWRIGQPVLDELERHHEVFVPTLPGHAGGESLPTGVRPSIKTLTDGIEAKLDRWGLEKVHVAGNSLGGWLALELVRRGRTSSVTLFSPAGAWYSGLRMATLSTSMKMSFVAMARLGRHPEATTRRRWLRHLLLSRQVAYPERMEQQEFAASIRAIRDSPVIGPLIPTLIKNPVAPLLDPPCPIRIVWAEQDRIIPFEHFGAPLLERVPSAELVRLGGTGHIPMSDAPEDVARLIVEVTATTDRRQETLSTDS